MTIAPVFQRCRSFVLAASALLTAGMCASFTQAADKASPATESEAVGQLPDKILYNRDVRPILADNCFSCHGPDSASRKAELRLDKFEAASEMNAIVPGEVDASEMIARVRLPDDDELAMPPAKGHKRLTEFQKQILERWIEQGAAYEPHWSFIPSARPELPVVSQSEWPRNPIDRFVLSSLESAGLTPAAEADRRTLARRLSLDLTGLPPEPAAVDAFVADPSPEYYERYVDSLLDSTRYGEHRGRYWLDYARYGDTHGIHFDNYREMWSYRDWVINAFNRNLPYDQFTIEQLAGDLLPEPTLEQRIATGFNRCNITTNEGGIIDEEYKVLYARDRTETTSTVWMALTTGCAVCHDHKFDPVSTKEFYSLSAFFNNTTQAVRDGNIANTPPIVPVPRLEDRARFDELPPLIAEAKTQADKLRGEARAKFDATSDKLDAVAIADSMTTEGLRVHAFLTEGAGPAASSLIDGKLRLHVGSQPLQWAEGHVAPSALLINDKSTVVLGNFANDFENDQSFSYGAWIHLTSDNTAGAILAKMNDGGDYRGFDLWLEGNRIGTHIIHRWQEDALKVVINKPLAKNQWHHVFVTYNGSGTPEGLKILIDGQLQTDRGVKAGKLTGSIKNDAPLRIGGRSGGSIPQGVRVNDVRFYDRELTDSEVSGIRQASRVSYLAQRPAASRSEADTNDLFAHWSNANAPDYLTANRLLSDLESEQQAIRARGTIAHVMNERAEPAEAFVLARGEYDQQTEKVGAETPAVLPAMPDDYPRNRLGLAKWLVAPDHPLTARVTVNRYWQEIFGTGLVATTGDFGITGELPTHPELLDWLAVDFRESGWDVKRLIRLLVTSATYRQAAIATPQKLDVDPANRLLSRGPRYRMDAEMVRDYALAVSGLLSPKVGGPSVKPYQPEGVWEAVAMTPSNTRFYKQDAGEALYRRSMYTFWKRSAPPASMDVFNAPSREVCNVRRERTNTPLQALAALNDPQLIEAARHVAANLMRQSTEHSVRIDTLARQLLSRPLDPRELEIINRSFESLLAHYNALADDAKKLLEVGESPTPDDLPTGELAAYTMVANQLLNVDEILNK